MPNTPTTTPATPARSASKATRTAPAATVLVVAARADARGAVAAHLASTLLSDTETVFATHAGAADLDDRLNTARRIYVLDPGRPQALLEHLRDRHPQRHDRTSTNHRPPRTPPAPARPPPGPLDHQHRPTPPPRTP